MQARPGWNVGRCHATRAISDVQFRHRLDNMKKTAVKRKPEITSKRRPQNLLPLIILCVLGAVAYWNSFSAPLVFDDTLTIERNAGVQFGDYLKPSSLFSRSILYLTFTLNYRWGGQDVWGYHLVNLLFHLLNGILIFFIAKQLFSKLVIQSDRVVLYSVLSAAFFLVHPVQTESVTYISSRSEVLSTTFYLIAFLLFVRRPVTKIGFLFSFVVGLFFLLGLGVKETVISLPAVMMLYDWLFLSNARLEGPLQRWRFYVSFVLGGFAAAYYLVTRTLAASIGPAAGNLPPWPYFLTQLRVITRYMRLIVLPTGLNLDYDFSPSTSLLEPAVLACAAIIVSLLAVAYYLRHRKPLFSFSIFWFFLTLAPTSSVVSIRDVIFEHRLYLPLIGIGFSLPLVCEQVSELLARKLKLRWKPVTIGSALIVTWIALTHFRNDVWADDARLWKDVAAKSPHKERSYANLFLIYAKRGDYEQSMKAALAGAENAPRKTAEFYQMIGTMQVKLGRYAEAAEYFKKSANSSNISDERATAYYDLGTTYQYMMNDLAARRRNIPEQQYVREWDVLVGHAEDAFRDSMRAGSIFWAVDSYVNMAHARGNDAKLKTELETALSNREDFKTLYSLAKLYFLNADYRAAAELFEKAEKLNPSEKVLYFTYAATLSEMNETDRAIEKYLMALRYDPTFPDAHYRIALLYAKKSDFPQAISHLENVLRNDSKHLAAHVALAKIYIQTRQISLARQHINDALSISPGNPEAVALRQQIGS
jgi:protein O-mannosyl-transferase